ncbi:MAG TPA: DUF1801 domain-containing protein [Candidatus Krumholzibacteria bacterium]
MAERSKTSPDALAEELNRAQLKTYMAGLVPAQRTVLKEIRELIRAAAPGATDSFSYGIPAVRLKGKSLVYYAAWQKHASIYPIASSITKEELKGFRTSKGTVQFPYSKPLPAALIKKLVKARIAEIGKE